jgi:RNA polymerase sigma-70 factor (ECF subfamily)
VHHSEAAGDISPAAIGRLPDRELVRRAQLGSASAFEQLVLSYGPRLHRYLAFQLRDEGEALDVFQETLAAAWKGLPVLRDTDRFWPWLCGIAAHKVADARRRRRPAHAIADTNDLGREDPGIVEARDAVESLDPRHREVLLLRYLLGLSEEEVATVLDIRVGTVKSRSARARRALLEALR